MNFLRELSWLALRLYQKPILQVTTHISAFDFLLALFAALQFCKSWADLGEIASPQVDLWLHRTVPRLELIKEIQEQVGEGAQPNAPPSLLTTPGYPPPRTLKGAEFSEIKS